MSHRSIDTDSIAALVFGISCIIGCIEGPFSINTILDGSPSTSANMTISSSYFLDILVHNLSVLVILVVGGLLIALPTVLTLYINGYVLGLLVGNGITSGNLYVVIIGIMPHGIFEFVGMLFGGIVGLSLCHMMFRMLSDRSSNIDAEHQLVECMIQKSVLALLLIIIAALIECTFTPILWRCLYD